MKYLLWSFVFVMLCTGIGLAQPSVSNSQASDVMGSTMQAHHHKHHKHHHHHHHA